MRGAPLGNWGAEEGGPLPNDGESVSYWRGLHEWCTRRVRVRAHRGFAATLGRLTAAN